MNTSYLSETNTNLPTDLFRRFLFHPLTWVFTVLALIGDYIALFQFQFLSPPAIPENILFFILVTLFAESALIFILTQDFLGNKINLLDMIMEPLTLLPKTIFIKTILLIPSGLLLLVYIFISPGFESPNIALYLYLLIAVPAFILLNLVTLSALLFMFLKSSSVGESVAQGVWHIRQNFWQIMKVSLPFLLLQVCLLGFLFANETITYDSAFIYTVTDEVAELNFQFSQMSGATSSRFSRPGDYFVINRPLNGLLTAAFKSRGIDLFSPLMFTVTNTSGAYLILITNLLTIPLQIGFVGKKCLTIISKD